MINPIIMGFKKEYWEYHGSFVKLPLILVCCILLLPLLAIISNGSLDIFIYQDLQTSTQQELALSISTVIPSALMAFFGGFSLLVQFYYLLNCLFDEKRDLSVMFWRSLPVSDLSTVITKLLTGALIIPSLFLTAAALLYLCLTILGALILAIGYDLSLFAYVFSSQTVASFATNWLSILSNSLWLLPLYSWLMLASIIAKKSPFLWAIVPVIAALVFEWILVSWFNWPQHFIYDLLHDYFWGQQSPSMTLDTLINITAHKPINVVALIFSTVLLYATYQLRRRAQ
ncbi:MAG: ABC transporter permease [Oceanospirillaceae bacterium]|nr:ABC transporter permease [Oceanospirillaceae bacterium]